MVKIFLLAFLAAANPTLLAAVTIMLLLPSPKRLLLGYLLGATMTSITLGCVIVFSLEGSSSLSTARNTLSPAMDVVVGAIALLIAWILRSGHAERLAERRRERKHEKAKDKEQKESLPLRLLGRGDPRVTFAVGAVLTLPGVSYLVGLTHIDQQHVSTLATVLLIVAFNVIMLMLLELPFLGYVFAPEWTESAVERFKAWLARSGRRIAYTAFAVVGVLLLIRAVIEFVT